jgi:hypothetical protein
MKVFAFALTLSLTGLATAAQKSTPVEADLIGDWRGDSICQVRESACHDEDSLYHVAKLPDKPGWFSMKLDKIVDGKPVTMGTTECSYDSAKSALTCDFPRGVFHFSVQGDKMTGTMNLSDGTLWRKLVLKKVPG